MLPQTHEVLDLTLPYVADVELETMIDQRATALARRLDAERTQPPPNAQGRGAISGPGSGRGQVVVQFLEKKRRKAWYMRGDEEVCWENWTVKVTVAEPKTESGGFMSGRRPSHTPNARFPPTERAKVRRAMESTLHNTVMKIVTLVNTHKDHIPPITTTDSNPFPYQINISQKDPGWTNRMGIY